MYNLPSAKTITGWMPATRLYKKQQAKSCYELDSMLTDDDVDYPADDPLESVPSDTVPIAEGNTFMVSKALRVFLPLSDDNPQSQGKLP